MTEPTSPWLDAPFAGEGDYRELRAFLAEGAALDPAGSLMHVGDLTWRLYQNTVLDPARDVRVWRDGDGRVLGFAWYFPPDEFEVQVRPDLPDAARLAAEMLTWGEGRRADELSAAGSSPLRVSVLDTDRQLIALLAGLGGERVAGEEYLRNERDLDSAVPAGAPPGYAVRAVGAEAEWSARVDLHREVWHPSKVTLEAYRRLRAAAGYDPELDLVAVAPDGTLAAYCICWWDERNRVGEFEPVGTRAAYRGLGLGKAVVGEGLRRLRERGAVRAIVLSAAEDVPSNRLYRSCGFAPMGRWVNFGRRSGTGTDDPRV